MSTTTIRIPEALKTRVARAAEQTGTSAHNFILEAIAEKAEAHERYADFHETAMRRYAEMLSSGKAVPWQDMRQYLLQLAAGKPARRPTAKKLPR